MRNKRMKLDIYMKLLKLLGAKRNKRMKLDIYIKLLKEQNKL